MNSKKKKILIITLVLVLLIGIVGITYAVFSYSQTGLNQELVTGDIYMHYKESNTLTLENALPSSTYDPNNYFEFQIVGKNTNTKYDIYYDINLNRGLVPTGKLEANRILDKFLKFRLVEVVGNTEQEKFTNRSYSDLSSAKRIYVETINKNTTSEITKTYRLYMWISNDVVIGNTENPDKDYDISTWNNLFGSIRVSVTGDFTEKVVTTDDSCFETVLSKVYTLNPNMTSQDFQYCVNYATSTLGISSNAEAEAFCQGTEVYNDLNLQYFIYDGAPGNPAHDFEEHNIVTLANGIEINNYDSSCGSDVVIPSTLPGRSYVLNTNMTSEELQSCVNYLTDKGFGSHLQAGETIEAFCQGTGIIDEYTFQDALDNNGCTPTDLIYFEEHNIITSVISRYPVLGIATDAFINKGLTNVKFPNSVIKIDARSFPINHLTSVNIPSSVTVLACNAFESQKDNLGNPIVIDLVYENSNLQCSDLGGK